MNMPFETNSKGQAFAAVHPQSGERTEDASEINLIDLWYNLLDFKWVALAIAGVALALGLVYATVATPIYSADVLLQVETKQAGGLAALEDVSGVLAAGGSNVTGEIEIITSRTVVESVANSMGLAQIVLPEYFPIFGRWLATQHEAALGLAQPPLGLNQFAWGGEKLKLAQFNIPTEFTDQAFKVIKGEGNTYALYSPENQLLGAGTVGQVLNFDVGYGSGSLNISQFEANPGLQANVIRRHPLSLHNGLVGSLSASEVGRNSSMIRVNYESPSPAFAVQFLNGLANAYLRQNVERKGQEAEQQLVFLDQQLPSIKEQLRKAEDALNVFVQSKGTIDPTLDTQRILGQDVELETKRVEFGLEREKLLQRFQPGHPLIQAIDDQLAQLRSVRGGVASQAQALPEVQQEYLRLRRDVEVNQALYTSLLNGAQQLKVAKAGTVGNVAIVDYAQQPKNAFKPRKGQVVALALLAGLFFGVLAAQVLAMLRSAIRDPSKLEQATGLSVYSIVPLSKRQTEAEKSLRRRTDKVGLLAVSSPNDPSIEALRSFRTGLQFATIDSPNKRVLITGPVPEIGKSFVSANFAAIMAQAGKRVLLIDGDMRKGTLSRYFIQEERSDVKHPGLSDVVAGQVEFNKALVSTELDNLHVLVAGSVPPNPSELLLHPNFIALLEKADAEYDYIIIDSPPVLLVSDASILGQHCSAAFIVARYGASNVRQVADSQKRLAQAGVRVNGLIFNGFIANRSGYYYGYGYGYGYKNAYGTYGDPVAGKAS
ncbi:polysaccharide biosynthesis tyrosine autokinase [Limnobacter parvus]|uniref:Polysaccharide biosynthesis tyrosine autokinase n=1 Tax=Limnobacter parvus TaxID=2939690 RepID=A0ABT1XD49_9BURK|nr:polysaccharide biosynthesis tyrosine autokinase [Limnobacter parvus]MCR2745207.1 polysaccharide biosynthesis tyrosine autokinase [Limnobacter parvus]